MTTDLDLAGELRAALEPFGHVDIHAGYLPVVGRKPPLIRADVSVLIQSGSDMPTHAELVARADEAIAVVEPLGWIHDRHPQIVIDGDVHHGAWSVGGRRMRPDEFYPHAELKLTLRCPPGG